MARYTFVIQVHPEGISTLENLSTHERALITDLERVGSQIEDWLSQRTRRSQQQVPLGGAGPRRQS
jgi:hypothetical protein